MFSPSYSPNLDSIFRAPSEEESVSACRQIGGRTGQQTGQQIDGGMKDSGAYLGRSLPSLLDEGCELSPHSTINHYSNGRWHSLSLPALRRASEETALGLRQHPGLEVGDSLGRLRHRAALLMTSDSAFVIADIGCWLAQLVTVPISPEQPLETIEYILTQTAARVLFVSQLEQVKQLLPRISKLSSLRLIVIARTETSADGSLEASDGGTALSDLQWSLPDTVEMMTLATFRQQITWTNTQVQTLRAALDPQALATIVYTLTGSGRLLGAMLSHENLSGSAIAAFDALPCLRKGANEVALSFLPLHHIFARSFVYGSLSYGQNLYFSNPRQVMKHLRELKPTVFFAVPRLLEKVYEGWLAAFQKQKGQLKGPLGYFQQMTFVWSQRLLERYQRMDQRSQPLSRSDKTWLDKAQLWAARRSVFRPIRQLFGGRLTCFIVGGAALPREVMTLFLAADLGLCQGYGLTEASSTVSFTRQRWSRAGTVGVPMPGVEMAIAPDGEIMVKAPYVMQGYYRHPEETQAVLEPSGWLHTGDRGEFSADGLLTLTGYKKALFKLSIGEYVAPSPIEQSLRRSPLVQQALVVGPGRKFCAVLIFAKMTAVALQAREWGLLMPAEQLLKEPQVLALFQQLVNQVNALLPSGSTIKRFKLVNADVINVEMSNNFLHSFLQSTDQLNREALYLAFKEEIDELYEPVSKRLLPKIASEVASKVADQERSESLALQPPGTEGYRHANSSS
jgi:long-chain acyl-CoA synthetase